MQSRPLSAVIQRSDCISLMKFPSAHCCPKGTKASHCCSQTTITYTALPGDGMRVSCVGDSHLLCCSVTVPSAPRVFCFSSRSKSHLCLSNILDFCVSVGDSKTMIQPLTHFTAIFTSYPMSKVNT